jgi:hypothetical protein
MAMPDVAPDPATVVLAADPGKLMNRVGTLSAIAARIAAIESALILVVARCLWTAGDRCGHGHGPTTS